MATKKMINKLNEQINLEFYSSNVYLQMAAWADFNGLAGVASYLKKHAEEELQHMHKLFRYVSETDSMAVVGKIDAPATEYKSLSEMFNKILAHEKHVTKKINELASLAWSEKDFATFNFLQWYVDEQVEEFSTIPLTADGVFL